MKKIIIRVSVLLAVLAAGWGVFSVYRQFQNNQQVIATTKVRKGDVVIRSYARGELRAVRSAMLIAPNLFGTVQVTKLAPLGAFAKEKDLIVEFDDADVQARLEDRQLELSQLDEQIKKSTSEMNIRNNQDQVELLRARYAVRRAELEVKRNELLSAIQARTNQLNLEEAERRLKQLQSDVISRQEQAKAELAVLQEKRRKALLDMQRERFRLSQVKLLAPMSGLVAIRQSRPMGMFFRGMQLPDIREGDQLFPGSPVADVLDLSELEIVAKVGELDRANLHEGQDVLIKLDAVAGKQFHGKIKNLSGTATANIWSGDPSKKFDVVFSVDMKELLTGLGAKPEQIRKVLETGERNRNKPPVPVMTASFSPDGPPMGQPGMPQGQAGAAAGFTQDTTAAAGGERRRGGGERGGGMSPEERQKMRQAFEKALGGRKPEDVSPEERRKIFEKLRGSGSQAGGQRGQADGPAGMPILGLRSQYTEAELANAKLPPPPEEDSQLDVLLRPGLLADVEIIVDKVPNAVHIPVQAVFDKDGKPIVYVKSGGAFEERVIKPLKRSESIMVISEGVQPGELVALADPHQKPDKKGKQQGGAQKPGMPVGGGAGAGAQGGR